MNPISQSTKIIRALLFACLPTMTLAACAPGSTVPATAIPTSTAMPTLAPTVTSIPTSTFTPVPTSSPTSTPTPRPIPTVVECNPCKITYVSNIDSSLKIYQMNEDGSHAKNLTPKDMERAYNFAWSPDGSQIAFTSGRNGQQEVYVTLAPRASAGVNADGSKPMNITNNPAYDGSPTWSPDGGRIAFISYHNGEMGIYVTNADGSNLINLGQNPPYDGYVVWSPNGSQIAFVSVVESTVELNVINADGSNPARHVSIGVTNYLPFKPFVWSPDGSRILFHAFNGKAAGTIYVASVDGANLAVTNLKWDGPAISPIWSLDGNRIAFVSAYDNEIYLVNADGSNPIQLTKNSAWKIPYSLAWSPGGSKIAFVARTGVDEHIYRMNADGSNRGG